MRAPGMSERVVRITWLAAHLEEAAAELTTLPAMLSRGLVAEANSCWPYSDQKRCQQTHCRNNCDVSPDWLGTGELAELVRCRYASAALGVVLAWMLFTPEWFVGDPPPTPPLLLRCPKVGIGICDGVPRPELLGWEALLLAGGGALTSTLRRCSPEKELEALADSLMVSSRVLSPNPSTAPPPVSEMGGSSSTASKQNQHEQALNTCITSSLCAEPCW